MRKFSKIILALIITSVLSPLVGCSPSITKNDAEKEIVSFMLDLIIHNSLKVAANYVQSSDQPWLNPPPSANLIIYAQPNKEVDKAPWEQLSEESINVWWYFDNKLIEATDNQVAIQMWNELYMFNQETHSWPYRYEFGILSISGTNRKATVYYSASSCPECGGGQLYTLRRNDSGEWEITDSELLWLS